MLLNEDYRKKLVAIVGKKNKTFETEINQTPSEFHGKEK